MLARALESLEAGDHVALVVERVEHTETIDANFGGFLAEGLDHIIGIVAVADEVLAA